MLVDRRPFRHSRPRSLESGYFRLFRRKPTAQEARRSPKIVLGYLHPSYFVAYGLHCQGAGTGIEKVEPVVDAMGVS